MRRLICRGYCTVEVLVALCVFAALLTAVCAESVMHGRAERRLALVRSASQEVRALPRKIRVKASKAAGGFSIKTALLGADCPAAAAETPQLRKCSLSLPPGLPRRLQQSSEVSVWIP